MPTQQLSSEIERGLVMFTTFVAGGKKTKIKSETARLAAEEYISRCKPAQSCMICVRSPDGRETRFTYKKPKV